MKYKVKFALVLAAFAIFASCSVMDSSKTKSGDKTAAVNANKTLFDQVKEKVAGTEKTGIPECDEILVNIENRAHNANDNSLTTFATEELAKQQISSYVRGGLTNKTPQQRAEIAKQCKQFAEQIRTEKTNAK